MSVSFTVAPNDRRLYAGNNLFASRVDATTVDTYTTNARFTLGDSWISVHLSSGLEFFELFLYPQAMNHDEMINITSNMTYFYDKRGSLPVQFQPIVAYSIRKYVSGYTGPQLHVKRQVDSLEADIYLNENASVVSVNITAGQILADK